MTNAGDALLQAILDEPDADDVRLIYADWLDEHGAAWQREHAALIRWQIATGSVIERTEAGKWQYVGRKKGKAISAVWSALKKLAQDLWSTGTYYNGDRGRLIFRRGFIEAVGCTCSAWMLGGASVAQRHPLTQVRLSDKIPAQPSPRAGMFVYDYWRSGFSAEHPHTICLPPALYDAVDEFFSEEERNQAASPESRRARQLTRGCVAWARSIKCLRCNDVGEATVWSSEKRAAEVAACPDCRPQPIKLDAETIRNAVDDFGRQVRKQRQPSFESLYQSTWPHPGES